MNPIDFSSLVNVLSLDSLISAVLGLFTLVFSVYLLGWAYHELLSMWHGDSAVLDGKRFQFLDLNSQETESDADEIQVMINGRYRKFKSNKSKSGVMALNDVFSRDVTTADEIWGDTFQIGVTPGGDLHDGFKRDVATPDDIFAGKFHEEKSPFRWWHDEQPSGLNDGEFMARDVATADDAYFDVSLGDTTNGDLHDGFHHDSPHAYEFGFSDLTEEQLAKTYEILYGDD